MVIIKAKSDDNSQVIVNTLKDLAPEWTVLRAAWQKKGLNFLRVVVRILTDSG